MSRASYRRYKAADFEPHIKGSGGIISTIAAKVGCEWETAERWLKSNARLLSLYEAECETVLDVAESVVYGNVQAAAKLQADARKAGAAAIVDSADAKWLLTKKGKRRGYGDESDITLKASGGGVEIKTIRVHLPAEEEAVGNE